MPELAPFSNKLTQALLLIKLLKRGLFMGFSVQATNLSYGVKGNPNILNDLSIDIAPGQLVAVLGENGAGKTTFLDLLMGFRKLTSGQLKLEGQTPHDDLWELRQDIAYLSEKIDIEGDWSANEFLEFNRFFYRNYSKELEAKFLDLFRVNCSSKIANMSAGEVRRVQIVSALATQPKLVIVDEITAVIDIVGRRQLLKILVDMNRDTQCTVVFATNILEHLEIYASHIMLIKHGELQTFETLTDFLGGKSKSEFSQIVADILEEK